MADWYTYDRKRGMWVEDENAPQPPIGLRIQEVEAEYHGPSSEEWPEVPAILTTHDALILHGLGTCWNAEAL